MLALHCLIEIPSLHSGLNDSTDSTPDQALGPVTLYTEPRQESSLAIIIQDRRELDSREHDYEKASAAVYGVSSGYWHRLRYEVNGQQGYGWLRPEDAAIFKDLHSFLYSASMTYLTNAWDGRMFKQPNKDSASSSIGNAGRNQGARIIDIHYRGTEPWYLVALVSEYCTGEPLNVIGTGWVPAYSEAGGNTVWYYSRGC